MKKNVETPISDVVRFIKNGSTLSAKTQNGIALFNRLVKKGIIKPNKFYADHEWFRQKID